MKCVLIGVGAYAILSMIVGTYLFCRGKVWKYEKELWRRTGTFVLVLVTWPILMVLLLSHMIILKADIEQGIEDRNARREYGK